MADEKDEKTPERTPEAVADVRLRELAAIGLHVGGRYKSVYYENGMHGGVMLSHIVGLDTSMPALVFQSDGVPNSPFKVVLLDKLTAFTTMS